MKTVSLKHAPVRYAGLALACLLLLTLLYLFVRHWTEFVQYCINFQIYMHRYLVLYLLQQRNQQYSGGLMLTLASFAYGFLHSIGPGHGKFVITTYLATHRERLNASRAITLLGSLMQGVVAIVFVVVLAVALNLSMGDLSLSRYWVEKRQRGLHRRLRPDGDPARQRLALASAPCAGHSGAAPGGPRA